MAGAEGVLPRNVSPAFVQSREMFNESVSLTGNGKGGGRLFKRRGFQKKKNSHGVPVSKTARKKIKYFIYYIQMNTNTDHRSRSLNEAQICVRHRAKKQRR